MNREKHTQLVLVGLVALALMAAACSPGGKPNKRAIATTTAAPTTSTTTVGVKKGGSLIYAAAQPPPGFNMNTATAHSAATRDIMNEVWPSVFHVAPDFSLVLNKDLMASASVTSQNPQTLVMKIKPLASWSDGVSITADDFIYFWQQQRDPKHTTDSCTDPKCVTNGQPIDDYSDGTGYRNIASVTGSDGGKTVTVVFSQPFADWQSLWSYIPPAHLAQKVGWNKGFDSGDPTVVLSGGPFKIQSYDKGIELTLVPNDKYWATPPNLDSIVFRVVPDPAQQIAALQSKQADMVYVQPTAGLVAAANGIATVDSELTFGTTFEQIVFNAKAPSLNDPVVRTAIATALDRPALLQATVGQFSGAGRVDNNRIFVNNQPQYKDNSGGLYAHGNGTQAEALLEQDGYKLGRDGIFAKAGVRLSFRVSVVGEGALGKQIESLLQAQLKPSGVELKIDSATLPAALAPGFEIGLVPTTASPFPSAANRLYAQAGAANVGQSGSAQLDALLNQGAAELDPQKQAADYNMADAIMWQNLWTLPLFQIPNLLVVRNIFVNVDNATGEGPFWNADMWGSLFPAGG